MTETTHSEMAPSQSHNGMGDLQGMLLELYLKNNPRFEHNIFIYSYCGVVDAVTNPFHFISGPLPPNVKKSIVLQNLPGGEMMQAFIQPYRTPDGQQQFKIESSVLYANKAGMVMKIRLDGEAITKTEKYRQFANLAQSLLLQFI